MTKKTYQYNFVSADPGSGKTAWAIRRVARWLTAGHPVLFVVPTRLLCDEIESRSQGRITALHGGRGMEAPVGETVSEVMKTVASSHIPQALVITDAAFRNMPYTIDPGNWILIRDEPREPLAITSLNCPDSMAIVRQHFIEFDPDRYDRLFAAGVRRSGTRCDDVRDDILGPIAEIRNLLKNEEHYELLFDRDELERDRLTYSIFEHPELYAAWGEVYFMGANFEHSFIYHMWQTAGVVWRNSTPAALSRIPSERLVIHYRFAIGDAGWSAHRRASRFGNSTYWQVYQDWITQELGDQDFVYVVNNSESGDIWPRGTRMPAECHGLNAFRHHTRCVLGASYLSSRSHEPFYAHYGSSTSDVRGMRNTQYYVQQLTRTAIRDYSGTSTVEVWVPTLAEARDLLLYFPQATVVGPTSIRSPELRAGQLRADWTAPVVEHQTPPPGHRLIWGGSKTQLHVDVTELEPLPKRKPMTSTERSRLHRQRRREESALDDMLKELKGNENGN